MFDITQALGLSRKGQVLLKQDSIGRRTIVGNYAISAAQAAAMAEDNVSDEDETMLIGNLETIEDGGRSIKSEDIDDEYETELVSDADQEDRDKPAVVEEAEKEDSLVSDEESPPEESPREPDKEDEDEEENEGPREKGEEEESPEEAEDQPEGDNVGESEGENPGSKEEVTTKTDRLDTPDSILSKIIKIEPTDYIPEISADASTERKVLTLASRAPVAQTRSASKLTSPTLTTQRMSTRRFVLSNKPSSSGPVKLTSILSPSASKPTALRVPSTSTISPSKTTVVSASGTTKPSANIITLPPGALFSGNSTTTIRLPTAGSNTKTYMITKSESGAIKKTPIILKTVPMGSVRSAAGSAGTSGAGTASTSGKTVYLTTKPSTQTASAASSSTKDVDKYTVDLVPTPTSLNTQVLKVLVGKPPEDDDEKD